MPYNLMLFRGVGSEHTSPVVTLLPEQWSISAADMCQSDRDSSIGVSKNRKRLPIFFFTFVAVGIKFSREHNPEKFLNIKHECKHLPLTG